MRERERGRGKYHEKERIRELKKGTGNSLKRAGWTEEGDDG